MDERLCKCERWVIQVEFDVWVHTDSDDECTPDEVVTKIMFEEAG
jgi:hypothetical protein